MKRNPAGVVPKTAPTLATRPETEAMRIRDKYPGLAKRADTGSRQAAMRLFCIECMGGIARDVSGCKSTACALWPYRMAGRRKERP